ncbi:MAG TPA: copper chaperone PCu(A)C [Parvularculaceae bacterium]|nr:copper chaperone PCu(A)C [Parvularculaceae bacterium]
MKTAHILIAALALAACAEKEPAPQAAKALSCEAKAGGGASVENAWIRAQADESAMTAAYFSLCNSGMEPIVLTGLSTPVAGMAELHETRRDETGVVSMAPTGDITLAPGERVMFEPGGKHAMLMSLAGAIRSGDAATLTLQFADGSSLDIEAVVKSAAEAATQGGRDTH